MKNQAGARHLVWRREGDDAITITALGFAAAAGFCEEPRRAGLRLEFELARRDANFARRASRCVCVSEGAKKQQRQRHKQREVSPGRSHSGLLLFVLIYGKSLLADVDRQ